MKNDKETRGHGDKETKRLTILASYLSLSPCLLYSLSQCFVAGAHNSTI